MKEQQIINSRIEKVTLERQRLREKLEKCDVELAELETAANVISRLMGGKSERARPIKRGIVKRTSLPKPTAKKPDGFPTMPELIVMALRHEKRPLEPREITAVIRRNWWPDVENHKIGSIVWRLNNRNDIQKVEGTSTYRLPPKEEAPDEDPSRNTSEASLFTTDTEAKTLESQASGGGT